MEGTYAGESLTCPHCQQQTQFSTLPPSIPAVATTPPLERSKPSDLAGTDQPPEIVAGCLSQLQNYLTSGEEVSVLAIQSRLMAITLKPDLIAATNRRIIILRRGLFSCQMLDSLWIDVADVTVQESITGATLMVRQTTGATLSIDKLNKDAARKLYRFCQENEEFMRVARYQQKLQASAASAARVNVNLGIDNRSQ